MKTAAHLRDRDFCAPTVESKATARPTCWIGISIHNEHAHCTATTQSHKQHACNTAQTTRATAAQSTNAHLSCSCRWPPNQDAGAARSSSCMGIGLEKLSNMYTQAAATHITRITQHHAPPHANAAAVPAMLRARWSRTVLGAVWRLGCGTIVSGDDADADVSNAVQQRGGEH